MTLMAGGKSALIKKGVLSGMDRSVITAGLGGMAAPASFFSGAVVQWFNLMGISIDTMAGITIGSLAVSGSKGLSMKAAGKTFPGFAMAT